MDANNAINLLNETFQNKFNLNQYQKFLRELFNTSNINVRNLTSYIKNEFVEYANSVLELGHYTDELGESIVFYVIELAKESSRDRARTMQRNLVSTFMKDRYDYALVAFYEPNSDDWRFSYIKIEYEFNEKGLKEKLSSPKRHSFLVGPNEPNHTCRKQLLPLMVNEKKFDMSEIDNVFSIENVTDEFFNKYKELFLELVDSLEDVKNNDDKVKKEFDEKNIKSSDFAKKLMGQIVFIYFLQKKGWLGVEIDKEWGTGPKNFFKIIFDKSVVEGKNFFNDVLEPLFYKGLSEDVDDNHYSMLDYKVPFLNGGLFEPINDYDWINTRINLDNNIFENIIENFNEFNFTVKEDEPLEKEVAVDPEMLGKVFENLLEVNDRSSMGAFYTPRHIVHYMCQESLINYIHNNSNILKEDLKIFITKGDLAINSIIRANDEKKKYNGRQYTKIELPNSIKDNSDELERLLQKVKVIDPAVGSGAFPVGMMNEIVKARYILRLLNGIEEINLYELKRETIENSLYGVDLELSATDITKLRFWLSLIVDEEDMNEIRPLPNLDNQIMCGNSLVDSYKGIRLFDDSLIVRSAQQRLAATPTERAFNELENKKREFFKATGPSIKNKLKNEIKELKWNFIEVHLKHQGKPSLISENKDFKNRDDKPFFIWELEFSEIFKGKNPGFDIVIGNPPYITPSLGKKQKTLTDEEIDYLEETYESYEYKGNTYVIFMEKGIDLLKENGILTYITPNTLLTNYNYKNIRNILLDRTSMKKLVKIEGKVFKDAETGGNLITIFIKTKHNKNNKINCVSFNDSENIFNLNKFNKVNQGDLKHIPDCKFLLNQDEIDFLIKLKDSNDSLIDHAIFYNGIKTGNNNKFLSKSKLNNQYVKVLRGKDIFKYYLHFDNEYVLFDKEQLWSNYDETKYKVPEKIIVRQTSDRIIGAYDNTQYFTLDSTHLIIPNNNINCIYLLGLLNSKLINYYYQKLIPEIGKTFAEVKIINLKHLPIKIDEKYKNPIINKVKELMILNKKLTDLQINFRYWLNLEYQCGKISNRNKLFKFWELNEKQFFTHLKKKIGKINDETYSHIKSKFEEVSLEINSLNNTIKEIEYELDELIYELYNLSEDEIEIVKNNQMN